MNLTLPPKVTDRAFARLAEINAESGALQALSVEFESSIPESADKQYLNVGNIRIETSTLPIE